MGAVFGGDRAEYAVLKALDTFGRIEGRKALQKILYFVNLDRGIFPYQWNSYGPYSEAVKYMSEGMAADGQIRVKPMPVGAGGAQFDMELTDEGKERLGSLEAVREIDSAIGRVHRFLGGKSPREMELLASVYYIASYDRDKYSDKVFDVITDLKPKANFTKHDVDEAMRELRGEKLLPA